jgi:UDP-N-acetylglucosamine/UDP-N-acetylgalactosamine diphosphorylase
LNPTFTGYDDLIKNVFDNKQDHVFKYWNFLNEDEKKSLLEELKKVDFDHLRKCYNSIDISVSMEYSPSPYIAIPKTDSERKTYIEAGKKGVEYIKKGKTAAFVVAGGQGSRLGYEGPKGKFPVGPVSGKSLFQIHAEKIIKYSMKYDVRIPFIIMTSEVNHDETAEYFIENKNFGLETDDVIMFRQNMIPSLDLNCRLILSSKNSLFKNPDGHGGSLTALRTSGTLDILKARGIETISYFQVDNPLVKVIDPVFIGLHTDKSAKITSKVIFKAYPEEKIGTFVRYSDGTTGVIEYSDLSKEKASAKDKNGNILYGAGSVAIHLFDRQFIDEITSGSGLSLPFHVAKKKIKAYNGSGVNEIDGYKYEKFVFDALTLTDKNLLVEGVRGEEFAPVKNPTGIDSVKSCQGMMNELYRGWLEKNGVAVPESVKMIEISPLVAVDSDDIDSNIKVSDTEKVYIS